MRQRFGGAFYANTPFEEWVNVIDLYTLDDFKTLLSSDLLPTTDQLQRLRWIENRNPGVYLALIRRTDGTGDKYVYIGYATSPNGCLRYRVRQHKSPWYSTKAARVTISWILIHVGTNCTMYEV
jgi:hypothetical protein